MSKSNNIDNDDRAFDNNIYTFIVDEKNSNCRLDKFITTELNNIFINTNNRINKNFKYSRSIVQSMILNGNIKVNDIVDINQDTRLLAGTKININIDIDNIKNKQNNKVNSINKDNQTLSTNQINLEIVYEDNDLLIINKPAGLIVHPGVGNYNNTLVHALINRYGDNLSKINHTQNNKCLIRYGIVHRLDKDTSGLLIIAKNDMIHYLLSEQFAKHEIKRTYVALVYGNIKPPIGKIETYIKRSRSDHTKMMVSHDASNRAKKAVTHYIIKKSFKCFSLLECTLETGRTHQIRVHMLYYGHPIVGDKKYYNGNEYRNYAKYGYDKNDIALEKIKSFPRQVLHAKKLEFIHPLTQNTIVIEAELPQDIVELIEQL